MLLFSAAAEAGEDRLDLSVAFRLRRSRRVDRPTSPTNSIGVSREAEATTRSECVREARCTPKLTESEIAIRLLTNAQLME